MKIFVVFLLLVGTFLLPINLVESTSNNRSLIINQYIRNTGSQETEYWALIVGVGIYADDPEQNRPLMLLEVDDFYNELLKSDIWSEDHIKVIKAEDATVSNILAGFRWLDKMEDENDISIVYMTTHGGQIGFDIPPFDEEDKTDEILSSYWSFAYKTQGIWDDELNILLNRLESKGVCLIVDSCYAGGFNDHWKGIFSLSDNEKKVSSKEWIENFSEEVRGQNRVVIMASCEDELSYSGGFAPYIIDGLRGYADSNSDKIVTAEEVFVYAEPRAYDQTPTIYDGYPGELPLVYMNETSIAPKNVQVYQSGKIIVSKSNFNFNSENSVIKGFVVSNETNESIEGAIVHLNGHDYEWGFIENETTSDQNGFYSINVPPCRCRLTVSAEGYCSRQSSSMNIGENETRWVNFSLYSRPPENSTICGFIKDNDTDEPLFGANISLQWEGTSNQFYINNTISDYLGFYQINVAEGQVFLDIEKEGYFSGYQAHYISDFEVLWLNFSLIPHPPENSVLCGYITDKETSLPLNNTRFSIQWIDTSLGTQYQNQTYTDETGFYKINVASPGELYVDVHKSGYEYYDPYRHDGKENTTTWFNITLEKQKVEVEFLTPLRALYINNKRVIPFNKVRIIGSIDIQPYFMEEEFGPWHSEVTKVEYYIDGKLKTFFAQEPYLWTWNEKTFGKHTIKIVAYDSEGNSDSKELVVYKIL